MLEKPRHEGTAGTDGIALFTGVVQGKPDKGLPHAGTAQARRYPGMVVVQDTGTNRAIGQFRFALPQECDKTALLLSMFDLHWSGVYHKVLPVVRQTFSFTGRSLSGII